MIRLNTRVRIMRTNSELDGLTGYVANSPMPDPIVNFYIVILDDLFYGDKAVNMIESCLDPEDDDGGQGAIRRKPIPELPQLKVLAA